ncbi:MAG: GAF domain-containing protein [Anaerolineales bacterium]|nr:GAF domain-containing protein [Anaerolineales bacterium]
MMEIFPELGKIQESLVGLANQPLDLTATPAPIFFSVLSPQGRAFFLRFEAVPSLQGLLMLVTDVEEFVTLEMKYELAQEQLRQIHNKLEQQTRYYEAIEERLLESSFDLRQTKEDFSDRVARLEALHKISVVLSLTRETKALLQLIVEQAASLLNADSCSVALLDDQSEELVFLAAVDNITGKRIPPGQGIMFRALRSGEAQVVHDVRNDPDHYFQTGQESNLRARSMVAVPLQTPAKSNIGVLAAVNRRETWFSDEDKDLLVTMASYAAIAIENTRLLEQVQEQARGLEKKVDERTSELNVLYQRQAALAAIELSINEQHELQKVIEQIVTETRRLITPHGHSVLLLWDAITQTYSTAASTSPEFSTESVIRRLRKEGGTAQWIIQNQQPIIEKNIHEPAFSTPHPILEEIGLHSFAGMPLFAEGQALGVLYAMDRDPREYTKEDLDFLMALANRAANAIVKVRLYEGERAQRAAAEARAQELRAREHHLAMLNDITRAAIEQPNLSTMLEAIADRLIHLFQADGCYITFWDEANKVTIPTFAIGPTETSYPTIKVSPQEVTITESVLQAGTAIFIDDLPNSGYIQSNIHNFHPILSVLALPLIADQQKLGAAILGFNETRSLNAQEIALGEQVARQVALAIAKIHALESAQEAAREADTLREAGAIVAATLHQREAIDRILYQLERVIPHDSASVQLIQGNWLEIVGGRGWSAENSIVGLRFPIPGDNPNTLVIHEGRVILLPDARNSFSPFREAPHNHIRSWLGVPLKVHKMVIGMLALDSKELAHFTPHHAELTQAFADQVAVAIENARLYETTKQNEFEAKTVRDILHQLNALPDIIEAFSQLTKGLKELTHCHRISLALLNDEKANFTMVAVDQPGSKLSQGTVLPVTATSASTSVLAGHIHRTPDLALEIDLPAEKSLYEGGSRSRLNVPLQTSGGVIGALNLTWPYPNGYQVEQIPILTQIADAIALAVQKARLYEMQSERAMKLDELRTAIAAISSELEIQKLYDTLLERAVSLINTTGGELGIYSEEEKVLVISACHQMDKDYRGARIILGDGVLGQVAQNRQPLQLRDYRQWEGRFSKFDQGPWIGVIASPISRGDNLLGVIALVDTRPERNFSASDLQILTLFSDHVAITLENARLFQEVQTLATLDELTKIKNRRRLFELGQIEFDRTRRHQLPLSAVMIDIDHFKRVNDTYGHAAGDQVMRILAQRCQQEIRKADIFGRYGGEEFTIILPHTYARDALNLAERLRAQIIQTPFQTERGEISITISLGVATYTDDIPDLASLIDRADTALLVAKNSGRNRIVVYHPDLTE